MSELNNSESQENTQSTLGTTTQLEVITGIENSPPIIPTSLTELQQVQEHQDILDFLAKPVLLNTATFANTAARGDNLYSLSVASTILPGGYSNWTNKLSGFYSIYATFCVDVIINATPFHAGAILTNYFPNTSVMTKALTMHARDLNGQSQLPGSVICNINQNHYSFKVPYVSTAEMFVLNGLDASFPDWGTIKLWCWSPLKVGASGATSITLSIWGHWEDVVLGPVYPQAGGKGKRKKVNFTTVNPESVEKKAPAGSSISSALNSVSMAADSLSDIPILGAIAGPVAWATDIASGIASFFGFSKPLADPIISRHFSQIGQYAHNGSGSSDALILATQHDAKTRLIEEKTIYEYDEMSLAFIKTRPAYFQNINYTTTTATGTQIDALSIILPNLKTSVAYDTLTLDQHTPVSFLANVFFQFTGGVKIKIKFFKTAFHAGTLQFAFVPQVTSATSYTINALATVNRYVIDIQTEDELIIEIPYQLPYPNIYTSECLGTLYVHAITPLRAPETVANNIDITYEVLGADDLTFYNPQADVPVPVICQGATEDVGSSQETLIGGSSTINDPIQISQDSIGEQINSIKQLTNRHSRIHSTVFKFTASNNWWFDPNLVGAITWAAATHTAAYPLFHGSYVELFAFCYAYRRGSTRWRFYHESLNSASWMFKTMHTVPADKYGDVATDRYQQIQQSNTSVANTGVANCVAYVSPDHCQSIIQVPQQHFGVVAPNEPYVDGVVLYNQPRQAVSIKCTSTADDLHIERASGDDFQFKFWIGIPVMGSGPI